MNHKTVRRPYVVITVTITITVVLHHLLLAAAAATVIVLIVIVERACLCMHSNHTKYIMYTKQHQRPIQQ